MLSSVTFHQYNDRHVASGANFYLIAGTDMAYPEGRCAPFIRWAALKQAPVKPRILK